MNTATPAGVVTAPKLCECGCGQPTRPAKKTDNRSGSVKGQPARYLRGHNPSGRPQAKPPKPQPERPISTTPCACGCGKPAPLAKRADPRRGLVAGQPVRFIRGHGGLARIRGDRPEVYAEKLLDVSRLLVGAVHFDGPDAFRAHFAAALRLIPPPGVEPMEALATVLAAQIDPDTTDEQRLGWVRAFDQGAAPQAAPTPPRQLPVRASPRKENAA